MGQEEIGYGDRCRRETPKGCGSSLCFTAQICSVITGIPVIYSVMILFYWHLMEHKYVAHELGKFQIACNLKDNILVNDPCCISYTRILLDYF